MEYEVGFGLRIDAFDGLWVALGQPWEIERERFAGPATCQVHFGEMPTLTEPASDYRQE